MQCMYFWVLACRWCQICKLSYRGTLSGGSQSRQQLQSARSLRHSGLTHALNHMAPRQMAFGHPSAHAVSKVLFMQLYVAELDRIVLKDTTSERPFASTSTCRKAVFTTRVLGLVHELCTKQIHVTKRDLFYTDVKLFEVRTQGITLMGEDGLIHMHLTWKSCCQYLHDTSLKVE